ncbi:MAG: RtcB family protein [Clostridia bacterium]|nr:RtcB family protein [Clostridia bacterium]
MVIKGKYNKARVCTDVIEGEAVQQIKALCDSKTFEGQKICIMPDVHAGNGCTIGTTMTISDKVVPQMVGVDIGCGMEVVELEERELDLKKLDEFIHTHIPAGMSIRKALHPYAKEICLEDLVCQKRVGLTKGYLALGTLGGGNHFIEVDKDEEGKLYLVVHSGSRHLGVEVAGYYQKEAEKYHRFDGRSEKAFIEKLKAEGREKDIEKELKLRKAQAMQTDDPFGHMYMEGELFQNYIHDMRIMQRFADLNRRAMTDSILEGLGLHEADRFTTVHNYIDLENMILRKGAVSAQKGEKLLIPLNMRDGSLICIGKGNYSWNYSAPHGAGRLMSRNKAKATLDMKEFHAQMEGIYSTTVSKNTLDESPMAYKRLEDIVERIKPTVKIVKRILPVYNFKSDEDPKDKWRKRK